LTVFPSLPSHFSGQSLTCCRVSQQLSVFPFDLKILENLKQNFEKMNLTFFILSEPPGSWLAARASEELSVGDRFRLAAFPVKLIHRAFERSIRWMKDGFLYGILSVD